DAIHEFGFGEHRDFPSEAVRFVANNREAFTGNMYNAYEYGGYLIYRLYPRHRVFIDGRTTFYGGGFYGEVIDFEAFPEPEKWKNLARKYGIDFAFLSSRQQAVSRLLTADPEWALVFWDDRALIYMRRKPEAPAFITKNEYIYTDTFRALEAANWAVKTGPQAVAVVREELERPLNRKGLSPNPIGLHALGFMEHHLGNYESAERALMLLTRMEPRLAGPHGLLGSIYLEQGKLEEARREFRKAAKKLPEFRRLLKNLDSAGKDARRE
ncbi:MAG: tetratricopeptide repeat protein, partial [bacterium]